MITGTTGFQSNNSAFLLIYCRIVIFMIKKECTSKDWIEAVSKKKRNADKILVEKVVRALMLLEGLATSDLEFVFKDGTALMLLLDT